MRNTILIFSGILFAILLFTYLQNSGADIHPLTHKWEKAIPHQDIPEGLASLSAEQCGVCHGAVAFDVMDCNQCHNVPPKKGSLR